MNNNNQFNKIVKKLDGRQMGAKRFYDFYNNQIDIGYNEIYLRKEVDSILKMLKEVQDSQIREIKGLKQKKEDLEVENYRLQKIIKKHEKRI